MRRICSSHQREGRILTITCLVLIVLLAAGCAEKGGKRLPTAGGKRIPQGDVVRPAEGAPSDRGELTPQRAASQELVQSGMVYLDAKNYDLAAVRFQDAVNVDPRNGEAYYYLALADYYAGQYDAAMGILDKARALLGHDEGWLEKIENLKASILANDTTGGGAPH